MQSCLGKQTLKKEKRFVIREDRFRQDTSFFVTNLPDGCTKERLWEAFGHFDNVIDAFVPTKRDGGEIDLVF
ncbi:putative RNA recognition motif domain, nucleotide-binding alpha-beta plait domain superfamily [Helianthus anomalus]